MKNKLQLPIKPAMKVLLTSILWILSASETRKSWKEFYYGLNKMEVYLKKTLSGLQPVSNSDEEALSKYKIGDELKAKLTKPRNPKFHRKGFALLNMAYENQDVYNNFDDFRFVVTMKAGFYKRIQTDKGEVFRTLSISYASMDQAEFEDWYSKVLDVIISFLEVTEQDIEENLINYR